jgi:hypothetical protein
MMKMEEVMHAGSDSPTSWYLASRHRKVRCNRVHALGDNAQQNEDPLESRFQPPSSSPWLRISLRDVVLGIKNNGQDYMAEEMPRSSMLFNDCCE